MGDEAISSLKNDTGASHLVESAVDDTNKLKKQLALVEEDIPGSKKGKKSYE